jgi:hypothetical protein
MGFIIETKNILRKIVTKNDFNPFTYLCNN